MAKGYFEFGVYHRGHDWTNDAASADPRIIAEPHDEEDDGFAEGLSNCICRDGQSTIANDIPWNNKAIVNLATPEAGAPPHHAATKGYVDNITGWNTSKFLGGTDENGRLNFTGLSGVNGITWTAVDMSLVGRMGVANQSSHRLVVNNNKDPAVGTDVFSIALNGYVNSSGAFSHNLSHDGTVWRTPAASGASLLGFTDNVFRFWSLDVATGAAHTNVNNLLRNYASLVNSAGNVTLDLVKSASPVGKFGSVRFWNGTPGVGGVEELRWEVRGSDHAPETATNRVGSNFTIYSYDNAGANGMAELTINRSTHDATFLGSVGTKDGILFSDGGGFYLRPNGQASSVEQVYIDTAGAVHVSEAAGAGVYAGEGVRGRAGMSGGYSAHWMNLLHVGGGDTRVYANTSYVGAIPAPCDYRIKQDVAPLSSAGAWHAVKALRPVSYEYADYDEVHRADGKTRWGFLAHELQEALLPTAASGEKDMPDGLQSPDPWAVIAALTAALQEAMVRIEALEGRS